MKGFKKIVAVVVAIAMVVSTMTVQTAKADIYKSTPSWMNYFHVGGGLSSESIDAYSVGASIGDTWWHIQTWIPEVNFTKGYTYTVSFTLTTSKPKWFRVDWTQGDTLAFTETSTEGWIENGDGTYSYDYVGVTSEQAATSTQALRVSYGYDSTDADNWATNEAITMDLTNFSLTREATGETEEDPTTVNDGWIAIIDGSTVTVDGYDLYAGMWNGGAMSYSGTTNEDLALKVTNSWNNPGGWGIQAKRYNTVYEGLEVGKTYTMKLSYNSTAAGTMFVKLEGANDGSTYSTVEGTNTHEIEFTYTESMGFVVLELGGITAGTEISNINFQFEEVVEETTTEEPSSEEPSEEPSSEVSGDDTDYSSLTFIESVNDSNLAVAFVEGDSASEITNCVNEGANCYVALKAAFAKPNFVEVSCNGNVQSSPRQGANFWIPMADLVENAYNVVEVKDAVGGTYHYVIRYGTPSTGEEPSSEDVETTTVEEEPSEEPSSEEPSSDVVSGDSPYAGLTYTDIANNQNNEFSATLKGSQYAVAEGNIGFAVNQYQNAGFRELYMAINKGADAANLTVTVNGEAATVAGTGVFVSNAADVLTYEYNVVEITSGGGNGKVIIYCPGNAGKGTYGQGGEEPSEEPSEDPSDEETTTEAPAVAPAAPEGLQWSGNENLPHYFAWAGNTEVASYEFYVNGDLVGTSTLASYDADASLFTTPGDYEIGVVAVGKNGLKSEMTTITYTVAPTVVTYEVSVDGEVVATVEEGDTYTLGDAVNGYICGDDAYKAGTEVTVNGNMAFTTIGDVTVTAAQGAGIRYVDTAGIRFQATVNADEAVLNSAAVTTGTIITANDIYEAHESVLNLDVIGDDYAALNVENSGWYNDQVGTYCGSIVNIAESNYIREFIAVAYATITYTDGTTTTVYSNMTGVRSIKGVAQAVAAAGYVGIDAQYHAAIDAFAAAK